jgi:hypothetical protein
VVTALQAHISDLQAQVRALTARMDALAHPQQPPAAAEQLQQPPGAAAAASEQPRPAARGPRPTPIGRPGIAPICIKLSHE